MSSQLVDGSERRGVYKEELRLLSRSVKADGDEDTVILEAVGDAVALTAVILIDGGEILIVCRLH